MFIHTGGKLHLTLTERTVTLEVTLMQVAVFVLGLLSIIPILLASTDQLYIRPSQEAPCPSEPCYLLSQILQNVTEYLTSNTFVMLAPGKYFVSEDIEAEIRNVHVTLMGSNTGTTVIKCSKQLLLSATSTDLVISNLNFFNCTHLIALSASVSFGLMVYAGDSNVTLINTSFNSSIGCSIFAQGSNLKFLGRTAFKSNQCFIGCGIFAENSNIVFHGAVVFQDNTCDLGCGIYAHNNTSITFYESAVFKGNEAVLDGGGIYVSYNCDLIFLDTVIFQNNTCRFGCGIFTFGNCNSSFNSSAIFESNKAVYYGGGAMITYNSALKFNSSATFQSNQAAYGGAMYLHIDDNAVLFLNSAEINITTNNASQLGGGIYILNSPSIKSTSQQSPIHVLSG